MKYSEVKKEHREWIEKTASNPENFVFRILSKFGIKSLPLVFFMFLFVYNSSIPPAQNYLALELLGLAAIYPAFNIACLGFFRQKKEINWLSFYALFFLSWVICKELINYATIEAFSKFIWGV